MELGKPCWQDGGETAIGQTGLFDIMSLTLDLSQQNSKTTSREHLMHLRAAGRKVGLQPLGKDVCDRVEVPELVHLDLAESGQVGSQKLGLHNHHSPCWVCKGCVRAEQRRLVHEHQAGSQPWGKPNTPGCMETWNPTSGWPLTVFKTLCKAQL